MDPICHTLVGAGLARSGLYRRTGFGTLTLLIGANLPDLDVLAYLDGPLAMLQFRRGWTHGILALAVWPFLLTGAVMLLDRLVRRVSRASLPSTVRPAGVLRLAAIAVLSHLILDTLNTYGLRWLMPFDGRWFYGDTLFIVDPWMWLALGTGVLLAGRSRGGVPARAGLVVASAYVLLMAGMALAGRRIAARELASLSEVPVERLMLSPIPIDPLSRVVVARQGNVYRRARFRWLARPHIDPASVRSYPMGSASDPAFAAAAATVEGRRFLGWARFPWAQLEPRADGAIVHLVDLRYADRPGAGFATVSIPVRIAGEVTPR